MTRPFASTVLPLPMRIVGWIIRGYPDEVLARALRPGDVYAWDDARTLGKEPGQPVLYLETAQRAPRWVGWGRIAPAAERWRVHGVVVECRMRIHPAWPAAPTGLPPSSTLRPANSPPGHDWETPALGRLLQLSRARERTPYMDTDARDIRLTAGDLSYLVQLQPRLATLEDGKAR